MLQSFKKPAVFLFLFIAAAVILFYISTLQGEFLLTSRSSLAEENQGFSEPVYLSTGMAFTGPWNPTILNVQFIGEDNFLKEQGDLPFQLFVDNEGHIGAVSESDLGATFQMQSVKNYKMKEQNMNLVFKVDTEEEERQLENINGIRITYSIWGMRRIKMVDFEGEKGVAWNSK